MSTIPALNAFKEDAKQDGNLIPIYRNLSSDTLTPVSAFELIADGDHAFLFESVVGGENIARYSFIGANPFLVFKSKGDQITVTTNSQSNTTNGNPWDELETLMTRYKDVKRDDLPRFSGGAVGYAGYDSIRFIEKLPDHGKEEFPMADFYFGFYNVIIAFDHITKTIKVIALADISSGDLDAAYSAAEANIDAMVAKLSQPVTPRLKDVQPRGELTLEYTSDSTREQFESSVLTAQEHIKKGDIFQVVLSQRLRTQTDKSPFDIYRVLRIVNPSPYMFFIKTDEGHLVGASPEVMVRLEDDKVTLRPIAGTRPRGKTDAEDQVLIDDLLADEKEIAEHVMLMDLGRNDVGRVSEFGTVNLDEKMVIEKYSHVMHIVSNVTGKIRPDKNAFDALKACLPAGTLSGAPKIRAMEIIENLEPVKRGIYGGAVGYIDFSGNSDTCIAIRTIIMKDDMVCIQAGAGIVLDSVPEREFEETLNKARGMLKAIEIA